MGFAVCADSGGIYLVQIEGFGDAGHSRPDGGSRSNCNEEVSSRYNYNEREVNHAVDDHFPNRRMLMKPGRGVFVDAIIIVAAFIVFPCFLRNAEAFRGGRAVEGPRGNVAVEGPRGNVAVGTRYTVLPASARSVIVGDRTYYVDDSAVYYLPCDDDATVFCVVPAPQ
jgi:hypothetical protein